MLVAFAYDAKISQMFVINQMEHHAGCSKVSMPSAIMKANLLTVFQRKNKRTLNSKQASGRYTAFGM